MNSVALELPPKLPEWPRIGKFIVIAFGLHVAVLLYPLDLPSEQFDVPQPATVIVRLVEMEVPAAPVPLPLPVRAAPAPEPAPPTPPLPRPTPTPTPKARVQVPRPVLAIPPEVTMPTPDFSAPVVAEPALRPPADGAPAPAPAAVTAARFDAAYLQNPRPDYPPLSRRLGEQGKVLLRVRVGRQGQAVAVDLEKSSDFARLDEAARQSVARWRFVPAKRGDEAIEATVIVPIVFRLEG